MSESRLELMSAPTLLGRVGKARAPEPGPGIWLPESLATADYLAHTMSRHREGANSLLAGGEPIDEIGTDFIAAAGNIRNLDFPLAMRR